MLSWFSLILLILAKFELTSDPSFFIKVCGSRFSGLESGDLINDCSILNPATGALLSSTFRSYFATVFGYFFFIPFD